MKANTSKTQWLRFACVGSQIHPSAEALSPRIGPKIGAVAELLNPGCHPCAHEKGPLQTQGWGGHGGGA